MRVQVSSRVPFIERFNMKKQTEDDLSWEEWQKQIEDDANRPWIAFIVLNVLFYLYKFISGIITDFNC